MSLIDLYIQEVTRRLPEKSREDIALELESTIGDMLPEYYTEEDIKSVLQKLGNPAVLARAYLDQPMHLIGPKFFDTYMNLLKLILPIAATISFISFLVETLLKTPENQGFITVFLTGTISEGVVRVLFTLMQSFFWFTLVFAVLERVDMKNPKLLGNCYNDWSPDDLNTITVLSKEKVIPRIEIYGRLLWTAIWVTIYFKSSSFAGVYKQGQNNHIEIIPSLNQDVLDSHWLIIVVAVAMEIFLSLYKWKAKQWTKKLAGINLVFQLIGSLIFIKIITVPNLFTPSFKAILASIFTSIDHPTVWFIRVSIAIFVLFAAIDTFQSFKKASIPGKPTVPTKAYKS